jgi:hypothetical protein
MPKAILPIANGFYESDSLPISAQECVNWYPNIVQTQALNSETLFGTAGLNQLATSGDLEANRGSHVMAGIPYFVNLNNLYRLNRVVAGDSYTYNLEDLGAITGSGRVSMADNGTQLCIMVPGGNGYIFTDSPDTLTTIVDVDFVANGAPQYVEYMDGYFIFTTATNKFIVSALNDGLAYNALDFGSGEKVGGNLVGLLVFRGQLFLFGENTMAAYQNRPSGADFPFVFSGLEIDKGLDAPFTVVKTSDAFMFIGGGVNESPAIWAFSGSNVQKVSTTAIDSLLQREDLTTSFAWTYAQKGAYFIGFSLLSTVLVFDIISQRWHERKSQIENARGNVNIIRFRANSMVEAYSKILCGDSIDGRVGELDIDLYTEYDRNILRTVATQPFQNNMEVFFVPSLELTVESGVGDVAEADPQVGLSISRDGKTFSDERFRRMGKIGDFGRRVIWRRNGRIPRFSILKFSMSEPIKPVIIQLTADITG